MTLKDLSEELRYQERLHVVKKAHVGLHVLLDDFEQALESKDRCEQKIRLLEAQIEQVMGDTEI